MAEQTPATGESPKTPNPAEVKAAKASAASPSAEADKAQPKPEAATDSATNAQSPASIATAVATHPTEAAPKKNLSGFIEKLKERFAKKPKATAPVSSGVGQSFLTLPGLLFILSIGIFLSGVLIGWKEFIIPRLPKAKPDETLTGLNEIAKRQKEISEITSKSIAFEPFSANYKDEFENLRIFELEVVLEANTTASAHWIRENLNKSREVISFALQDLAAKDINEKQGLDAVKKKIIKTMNLYLKKEVNEDYLVEKVSVVNFVQGS